MKRAHFAVRRIDSRYAAAASSAKGQQIYNASCMACHEPDYLPEIPETENGYLLDEDDPFEEDF